jgi:hypothetical protein
MAIRADLGSVVAIQDRASRFVVVRIVKSFEHVEMIIGESARLGQGTAARSTDHRIYFCNQAGNSSRVGIQGVVLRISKHSRTNG